MIDFTVLKTKVYVSPFFFSVLTLILLLDKTGISGYAVLFSLLHEMGHILALLCKKIRPKAVVVTLFGIHIELPGNLGTTEKCIVLMAGFTANFLLGIFFFCVGKTDLAVINIFLGIFTALPIASTDGGSILKTVLEEFFSHKAEKIFKFVSGIFVSIFLLFLILVFILTKNVFIFITVFYMIFCTIKTAVG